jgi:cellulose synthase/poly-beta-1,6-N-acetylglucosamine synthase-like glycosyltransferase
MSATLRGDSPPVQVAIAPAPPALTVGVPASASEADLAATLASLDASAARSGRAYELLVAINGPESPSPALAGVRGFAAAAGLTIAVSGELEADATLATFTEAPDLRASPSPRCALRVLRLAARSKIVAWNAIRAAAAAPLIVFADADVRVSANAVGLLVACLEAEPRLAAVAGREVAVLAHGDGFISRVGALPYRFDFANIPGRLYAVRADAVPPVLPANVIAEDGYLTVQLGRERFTRAPDAVVYLRPPATSAEYLRQRVRHELGKMQLARELADVHRVHGFGRAPWRAFLRDIRVAEYPLVAGSLAFRGVARVAAWWQARHGFAAGWQVLPTTKRWPQAANGAERSDAAAAAASRRTGA